MRLRTMAGPLAEPLSLAEIKEHLRVVGADEDGIITAYSLAAREMCELEARRAFVTQGFALGLSAWPCVEYIALPRPPLQSVTSIAYVDADGVTQTMPPNEYIVDVSGEPGRVWLASGAGWPSVALRPGASITISYVAGYGLPVAVPERYKAAIRLLTGHYYENREQVVVMPGVTTGQMPDGVRALLRIDRGWF